MNLPQIEERLRELIVAIPAPLHLIERLGARGERSRRSLDEVGPQFREGDAPSARVRVAPCVQGMVEGPLEGAWSLLRLVYQAFRRWRRADSNRRPPACKAGALPTELRPRGLHHRGGSSLSGVTWTGSRMASGAGSSGAGSADGVGERRDAGERLLDHPVVGSGVETRPRAAPAREAREHRPEVRGAVRSDRDLAQRDVTVAALESSLSVRSDGELDLDGRSSGAGTARRSSRRPSDRTTATKSAAASPFVSSCTMKCPRSQIERTVHDREGDHPPARRVPS